MATEQDAINGLDSFINGLADNLGASDPSANRVISRTMSDGTSETYSSLGDQLHAVQKALDIQDQLEARKVGNRGIHFFKLTKN